MILQERWTADRWPWAPWVQGITDTPVGWIECWHSEWTDDGGPPWIEWRIIDAHGQCRVAWRESEPGIPPDPWRDEEGKPNERTEDDLPTLP